MSVVRGMAVNVPDVSGAKYGMASEPNEGERTSVNRACDIQGLDLTIAPRIHLCH